MTLGYHHRLAVAVFASAGIHMAVLVPIKAPSGPFIATPVPQAFLSATLRPNPSPLPDIAATPVSTPLAITSPQQDPPQNPAEPMMHRQSDAPATRPDADKREHPVARSSPSPASPQSSGEQEGQRRPGVRVATPDEVKVRVVLYSAGAEDNPNEVMETATGKYVYFNAPRLKQNAHPIADARPHYPTTKLEYPHGAVTLLLQIDEEGKLEKTSVLCANPTFKESAIASIQDMRFTAARDATGPVKSYMMVEFGYGIGAPCGPLPHNLQLDKRSR